MRRASATVLPLLAIGLLAAACKGPEVPHPLVGQQRYLCCNIYFEKPKINDALYQVGTKVPFGTRVEITHVRKNEVEFTPAGFPTITLEYKWGIQTTPFDTFLDRFFVEQDPHAKLRKVPAKRVAVIEEGALEPGMTKDQVMMARGIPPAHRTPSLESSSWTYWQNRWVTIGVYFDGDKVARVSR
jgi:hypothetical protein